MAWLPGGGRGRYSGFPSGTDVFPTASARALRVSDSCVCLRAWRGFEASARCPPHEKEDYSCRYSSSLSLDSLARVFAPVTISAAKIGIPTESAKFFTEKDAVPVYGDSGRPDLPPRLPVHDSVHGQRQATCTPSKSSPPCACPFTTPCVGNAPPRESKCVLLQRNGILLCKANVCIRPIPCDTSSK